MVLNTALEMTVVMGGPQLNSTHSLPQDYAIQNKHLSTTWSTFLSKGLSPVVWGLVCSTLLPMWSIDNERLCSRTDALAVPCKFNSSALSVSGRPAPSQHLAYHYNKNIGTSALRKIQ